MTYFPSRQYIGTRWHFICGAPLNELFSQKPLTWLLMMIHRPSCKQFHERTTCHHHAERSVNVVMVMLATKLAKVTDQVRTRVLFASLPQPLPSVKGCGKETAKQGLGIFLRQVSFFQMQYWRESRHLYSEYLQNRARHTKAN